MRANAGAVIIVVLVGCAVTKPPDRHCQDAEASRSTEPATRPGAQDDESTRALRQACDREIDADACASIMKAYMSRGLSFLTNACDGGDVYGCAALAVAYAVGFGVPVDERKALSLLQKACDSTGRFACVVLADAHAKGKYGLAMDTSAAAFFARKACQGGPILNCMKLAAGFAKDSRQAETNAPSGPVAQDEKNIGRPPAPNAAVLPTNAVVRCIPGATSACTCFDGRAGAQQCSAKGAFAECKCTGPKTPPVLPPPPAPGPIKIAVAKCLDRTNYDDKPSVEIQMAITNSGPSMLDASLDYTFLSKDGAVIEGAHSRFDDVRPRKTFVQTIGSVENTRCADIGRVEVTSAKCSPSDRYADVDCFETLSVGKGALVMTK